MRIFSQTYVSASIEPIEFVTIYPQFFTKFFIIAVIAFKPTKKRALLQGLLCKVTDKCIDYMFRRPLIARHFNNGIFSRENTGRHLLY